MRNLLAVVAILGLATTAFGGSYSLQFAGGATEITLVGSQYADIEIWLNLPANDGYSSGNTDLTATYVPAPADFTVESITHGPLTNWLVDPPGPGAELNGWVSALYANIDPDYFILGPADVLLLTIRIHCTGAISTDTIGFDTGAGNLNRYAREDYSTEGILTVGGPIIVNQIPEPASLALLALGGLALIRRR